MRFREAKEAGLDHLPALYVAATHLNQHKLHFADSIDLNKKTVKSTLGRIDVHWSRFCLLTAVA